jgi:hypothetical protein
MTRKNRTKEPLKLLSAEFNYDEVEVEADWRYQLVVPYIRHSASYLAVRDKYRGAKVKKSDLPKDEAAVYKVADWFDLLSVEADDDGGDQIDWWERAGKSLYGFDMPIPAVSGIYMEAGEVRTLHKGGRLVPTFLIEVPLNLTMTEAQKGIKDLIQFYMENWKPRIEFGVPLPEAYKAHYKLEKSKLKEDTLVNGLEALTMYKAGVPLWKIGNDLNLSPAHQINGDLKKLGARDSENKRVLSIKARQLVKIASLVAENAARGRFPSKKMFPEAMLGSYERDAGRPVGSKSPKTRNVTKYKSF